MIRLIFNFISMKKTILCGIILSLSSAIFAQSTFSLRYGPEAKVLSNVYPTDSCIYALGIALDSINPNSQGNIFLKLDLEGNVISTRVLTNPYKPYAVWKPTLHETSNENLISAGYSVDTVESELSVILIEYDLNGDTILTKEYLRTSLDQIPFYANRDMIIDDISNLVLCNTVGGDSITSSNSELLVLYPDLTKKFSKVFVDSFRATPESVIQDTDGGYIIGIFSINVNQVLKNFTGKTHIIKVDTLGEIQWEYLSPETEQQRGATAMVKASDGGLIVTSGRGFEEPINSTTNDLFFKNIIYKLDENQEVEWEVDYSDLDTGRFIGNAFYRILDVGDGYVAAGANADQELPSGMDGILHKISYDGERIWERKYYLVENVTHFASHEFFDMRQTSDNGFIMAGQIVDYSQSVNFQQGWIVKVDEYGCLVPGCHLADATIELTDNQPVIQLYPNPTTDFLNIYFKNPNQSKDGVFQLIDLQGRVVVAFDADKNDTTYLVSLEKYASGIYFLQYVENGIPVSTQQIIIQK
jgi:hypothetical protein